MNNIICLKYGSMYNVDYVNILYAMCKRNLTAPFRFFCITDNTTGLHKRIETITLERRLPGWWGKVQFFKPHPEISGTVLAIDLDMVVVDNIDCFFSYKPGSFCMKWDYAGHGHSSCVMRFEAGTVNHIYQNCDLTKMDYAQHNSQPRFKRHKYWGDQIWITEQMVNKHVELWPKEWIPKFAIDCHFDVRYNKPFASIPRPQRKYPGQFKVPQDAKIIAFAGMHQRNERELPKIGQYWHARDI